ncbi:MbtH family protein [Nocardiopsis tropica]|uniref:MbtH family protein n=1 Tax=Tsukamurella strandjordii TaxID=147577 RepID=UPI0031DDCDEA
MNPFDDAGGEFLVLINAREQRSLWPVFADVPPGWTVDFGPDTRDACQNRIAETWTDLRPLDLRDALPR